MINEVRNELRDHPLSGFLWNSAREGMAFVDQHGVMAIVNPAFAKLLGYSVHELEGRTFASITISADTPHDIAEFERLLAGEIEDYSMVKSYRGKIGSKITVALEARKYLNGTLLFGQIIPIDILSLEALPPEQETRIIQTLVGRWLLENWKKVLGILLLLITGARLDVLLKALAAIGK